ncbi:MAG: amidohydrolase [Deltaproteobacteria bacterium]|nr:amidohydrolase [Deltaproteobacteria bacterium]
MIIDAHNHVDWFGYTPEKLIENMNRYHIDVTWLLTWEASTDEFDRDRYIKTFKPGQIGMPFTSVADAVSKYPARFIPGYCPDPRKPDALDRLRAAVEYYGVKVCGELKFRMMCDNIDAVRLYQLCGQYKLPVVVHLDYPIPVGSGNNPRSDYWYGGGLDAFERTLRSCPDTVFIGHASGFWAHISKDNKHLKIKRPKGAVIPDGDLIRILREYPNLYADLSAKSAHNALSRDLEFSQDFLLEFQDKLLFARDDFTDKLQKLLEEFSLPESVMEKIYSKNALRLVPGVYSPCSLPNIFSGMLSQHPDLSG